MRAWLSSARETFWVIPAASIAFAATLGVLVPVVDQAVTVPGWLGIAGKEDTARAVLTAIVAMGVSIAGVSFSVIVVALVLASQQLSPRVLRSFQRHSLNQAVLGLLLGTTTYALFVLGSVSEAGDEPVPELAVTIAMFASIAALGLFTAFLHHAIRSLNASVVIRRIAAEGHASIAAPYPAGAGREPEDPAIAEQAAARFMEASNATDVRAPRAGYIASIDGAELVARASQADAFVVQRRGVGDFAVTGAVLATVYSGAGDAAEPDSIGAAFLLEEERVVDGDIAFPIRQLADIALKGLSPGVNDPTTAENAMNSVADTLVRFAQREPISALRVDKDGTPRLRALAPSLDELLLLGFDEVRRDAANRPSFGVRLLELLADVRDAAPAARGCDEVDRQAQLITDHAASLATEEADQRMVVETYERLHGPGREAALSR